MKSILASLLFSAAVLSIVPAHAEMIHCIRIEHGMCDTGPIGRPFYGNHERIYGSHTVVREEEQVEHRHHRGPRYGSDSEFPVVGIRDGDNFDGVSNPTAVEQCYARGGHLVAHYVDMMPNGQRRYKNTCDPGRLDPK